MQSNEWSFLQDGSMLERWRSYCLELSRKRRLRQLKWFVESRRTPHERDGTSIGCNGTETHYPPVLRLVDVSPLPTTDDG